jgi:hypothetical protein
MNRRLGRRQTIAKVQASQAARNRDACGVRRQEYNRKKICSRFLLLMFHISLSLNIRTRLTPFKHQDRKKITSVSHQFFAHSQSYRVMSKVPIGNPG